MPEINRASDPSSMFWKLIDGETGAENHRTSWKFTVGEQVKIRLVYYEPLYGRLPSSLPGTGKPRPCRTAASAWVAGSCRRPWASGTGRLPVSVGDPAES